MKQDAVYSRCGHRCDLCIHYEDISEEKRVIYAMHVSNMWYERRKNPDEIERCIGCSDDNWVCKEELCEQMKCAKNKKLTACTKCMDYPCLNATVGEGRQRIHTNSYKADDITYGLLPYTPFQYER